MKTKKILSALMLILMALFVMQCEKGGVKPDRVDDDSDRPEWAGDPSVNPNIGKNDNSGDQKGGDYGDLYELLRFENGVPDMIQKLDEWYVQPVASDGSPLELNDEGEIDESETRLPIPVEFGRLNIVRSPASVLDQAFDEAMKVLKPGEVVGRTIHVISLDFCGRLTSEYSDNGGEHIFKTIDSPRENMAIYKEIMQNLFTGKLLFLAGYFDEPLEIAASCFAAGSDKTGIVNLDEMVYINGFMDCIGPASYAESEDGTEYFNFEVYMYQYTRDVYKDRYIQNTRYDPVDETGYSAGPVSDIWTMMEMGDLFTEEWPPNTLFLENAKGFTMAIDDAVQVLDLIHGDSNLRFTDIDGNPIYY